MSESDSPNPQKFLFIGSAAGSTQDSGSGTVVFQFNPSNKSVTNALDNQSKHRSGKLQSSLDRDLLLNLKGVSSSAVKSAFDRNAHTNYYSRYGNLRSKFDEERVSSGGHHPHMRTISGPPVPGGSPDSAAAGWQSTARDYPSPRDSVSLNNSSNAGDRGKFSNM